MRHLKVVLVLLTLSLLGCTSGQVWVISQSDVGGRLGYHGYPTGPLAKDAVASQIACRPYELNEDVEKSRDTVSDRGESSKVPDSSIEDWHEVSYSCVKAGTP